MIDRPTWIDASVRVVAPLCAIALATGTTIFAWQGTLSVIVADAWGFLGTFLWRYYEGTLTPLDFFVKRGGLDHAQPLQKLLFLVYARYLDLDFAFEAMIGIAFAALFVLLVHAIVRADVRTFPRARTVASVALLGFTAIVFSLNDLGVFDWSLATLAWLYPFGVALLLAFAFHCIARERAALLAVGVFVACVVFDTSAMLCAAGIIVLVFARLRSSRPTRTDIQLAVAIGVGAGAYVLAYATAFPGQHTDMTATERIAALLARGSEAWKIFVIPFGAVVLSPSRIKDTFGIDAMWRCLVPAAIVLWLGHLWFWREFRRRREERLPFVAAGLMLYFYGVIAGIVWGRVPEAGFDYLMQSRYVAFYEMQSIAILMMAASKAARVDARAMPALAFATGVATATALAAWFLYASRIALPYQIAFNRHVADDIVAIANDPKSTPPGCAVHPLAVCAWPLQWRINVLGMLRREQLNVFSPRFRARHGFAPLADRQTDSSRSASK